MVEISEAIAAIIFGGFTKYNCTDKAIPLQALTGPQRSGRLRLPDFKTIGT
jgi:hypothetical protein